MFLIFKEKNGSLIRVTADNLLSADCQFVEVNAVYENGIGRPAKKKVTTEPDGKRFFIWNDERVYLGDYLSSTIEDLQVQCANDDMPIEMIYSTLIRYSEDIAFLMFPTPYSAVSDKVSEETLTKKMLYIPSQRKKNTKDNWNKEIIVTPYNKEYWPSFSDLKISVIDFAQLIKTGQLVVVNKHKFISDYTQRITDFEKLSKMKKKRFVKKNGELERFSV